MATFLTGLAILLIGGYLYGLFIEKIFHPDDRETRAVKMELIMFRWADGRMR